MEKTGDEPQIETEVKKEEIPEEEEKKVVQPKAENSKITAEMMEK